MKNKIKYFHLSNKVTVFLVRDSVTGKSTTVINTYVHGQPRPKVDVYEDGILYNLLLIKSGGFDRAYGYRAYPLPK
jgi:hypothetical protein